MLRYLLTAISQAMGGLKSAAKTPEPLKKLTPIDATITWDLSSRQLMYCWPVCGLQTPTDYAALQVIATYLRPEVRTTILFVPK